MNLFTFDKLLTPMIIKFLFYFFVAMSVISGFAFYELAGLFMRGQSAMVFLGSLVIIISGVIISRVATELILVLFMIRDELAWQREQRQQTGNK